MRTSPYREDDRAVLTNQHIQADLKKTGIRYLLQSIYMPLALGLLAFLFCVAAKASDAPVFLWVSVSLAALFGIYAIFLLVTSLQKAVIYLQAVSGNRFFVTTDKLIKKEEGRRGPKNPSAYRALRTKPNGYYFASGTYEVDVEAAHFTFDRNLAMNERTLFRHSEVGDEFLLVSLKPGKPVKIYPEKRFRYTDSSPL